MLKALSLSAKMTLVSALLVSVFLLIGIFLQSRSSSQLVSDLTLSEARAIGEYHAEQIAADLDRAMTVAGTITSSFRGIKLSNPDSREPYNHVLHQAMIEHPFLAGAWAGFEPNALDGKDKEHAGVEPHYDQAGRYTTYFYNFGSGIQPYRLTDLAGAANTSDPNYDYYNIPLLSKKPAVVDPVLYNIEGQDVLLPSFTFPVVDASGKAIGVIGVDMTVNSMSEAVSKLKPFETGSVDLISNKGLWVSHGNPENFGKPAADTSDIYKDALSFIQKGESHTFIDGEFTRLFVPVKIAQVDTPWSIVVNIPNAKLTEAADNQRNIMLVGGIILVILVGVLLLVTGNVIIKRPMKATIGVVNALQDGNFDIEVPDQERGDEIGQVNRALEQFKENSQKVRQMEIEQAEAQKRNAQERRAAQLKLADDFEASVGEIVRSVSTSSANMSSAAGEMSRTVDISQQQTVTVAGAAEEASVNVQTVAASTEELSASINEISQQVARSAQVASNAVEEVDRTNDMVNLLAEAADRIGEVVNLINDIAEQTNLLALNATIEAARAGDAGKGFAVVANEVKSLANQTANATDEIVQQITAIQGETRSTVQAIGGIGETIKSIHNIATTIAAAVEEQEAATREISNSVQQAASGTAEVSANVEGMRETAATTGAAAEKVQTASAELEEQSTLLDTQMKSFLGKIRTE
ncbi:MAG: methyl-accepting chemotaxis protein [Alphaproteobacteria bacterium]|nr:methyl-accepting chemotaxis protein [Alphaproteobacteria bacterium]